MYVRRGSAPHSGHVQSPSRGVKVLKEPPWPLVPGRGALHLKHCARGGGQILVARNHMSFACQDEFHLSYLFGLYQHGVCIGRQTPESYLEESTGSVGGGQVKEVNIDSGIVGVP